MPTAAANANAQTANAEDLAPAGEDYLTVSLGPDLFALKVSAVHEVLDPPAVTLVPNAPDFAPGLINVRGNIVPLIDLRRRLAMDPADDTEHSRVIVSKVDTPAESFFVGIKADAVHEVVAFPPKAIEPLPENGTRWPTRFLDGVAKHDSRYVIILSLEQILQTAEA